MTGVQTCALPISNPWIRIAFLTLGILIVAILEEVIFRGLYSTILADRFQNEILVSVLAALVFGTIHWSLGISTMVHTALIGFVFMFGITQTRSVLPTMAAHYAINLIAFSGIIEGGRL